MWEQLHVHVSFFTLDWSASATGLRFSSKLIFLLETTALGTDDVVGDETATSPPFFFLGVPLVSGSGSESGAECSDRRFSSGTSSSSEHDESSATDSRFSAENATISGDGNFNTWTRFTHFSVFFSEINTATGAVYPG